MDAIDLTGERKRRVSRHRAPGGGGGAGYPLRALFPPAGQRTRGGNGNGGRSVVVHQGGISPDPRDWTWVVWAQAFFGITIWGIVVAGFILLVVRGNKCCV